MVSVILNDIWEGGWPCHVPGIAIGFVLQLWGCVSSHVTTVNTVKSAEK